MKLSDRRLAARRNLDLKVTRQSGLDDVDCEVENLSPSGVRLKKAQGQNNSTKICNLELHLVQGSLSTLLASRVVWENEKFEGFEFISPSFAQQMIIERLAGNL